jgi:hypothetical protein
MNIAFGRQNCRSNENGLAAMRVGFNTAEKVSKTQKFFELGELFPSWKFERNVRLSSRSNGSETSEKLCTRT